MFKCLREISSQGMEAVGERLVEEVLKCTVSTVTGAARAHDSGTVICYQSHKIQIKHTALKQRLQMWVCFSLHLQSSSRCLEESKAAFHSRCLCYSFFWLDYTFKREAAQGKEKGKKKDAFCHSTMQWGSTDEYPSIFSQWFLRKSAGATECSALSPISCEQSFLCGCIKFLSPVQPQSSCTL